jgi:hypothetical protein
MRKLPENYSDIEKSLPLRIGLNNPVKGFYTNPITKRIKDVKIESDTTFSISAVPNKVFAPDEDIFVESDVVATRAIINGKNERIFANFRYKDLVENGIVVGLVGGKYKTAKKSVLIFGVPREYLITGVGVLMIIAGVYIFRKKKK